MTARGMIFNGEMVRAILDGRKTQTRRIVNSSTDNSLRLREQYPHKHYNINCPFGQRGDRIWVRETWARYNIDQDGHDMAYRATTPVDWPEGGRWRPSIHMPRWASRILLEITDVRVERLNSISEVDAEAEGVTDTGYGDSLVDGYRYLWKSIYGEESWAANPWVWVIEFKRIEGGAA